MSFSEMEDSKESPTYLQRSYSLDPSLLQRPPSGESIRSLVRSQSVERSMTFPSVPPGIHEESPEDLVDDLNDVHIHEEQGGASANSSLLSDAVNFSASCMECVKPYRVLDRDDISPGDHIIYSGAVYDHHAIVETVDPDEIEPESKVKVNLIHATNTALRASSGLLSGGKAKVTKTQQVLDFRQTTIMIVKYSYRPYTSDAIVERAQKAVTENSFEYHLFKNNCEHFATWCVTDDRFSVQVGKFRMTLKMFVSRGFTGLSDERQRNEAAYKRGLLCKTCYEINNRLFTAPRKSIRHPGDVQPGDIITYTYYKLHHDAVVLQTNDKLQRNKIQVTIAHYAFCGLFSNRTIKEEQISIPTDGSVTVIQYEPPNYEIYTPEETVQRARQRLGEQFFSFFANDSSHFSRWCKLKLTRTVMEGSE